MPIEESLTVLLRQECVGLFTGLGPCTARRPPFVLSPRLTPGFCPLQVIRIRCIASIKRAAVMAPPIHQKCSHRLVYERSPERMV